jgi:Excalibur calcium-binding domain
MAWHDRNCATALRSSSSVRPGSHRLRSDPSVQPGPLAETGRPLSHWISRGASGSSRGALGDPTRGVRVPAHSGREPCFGWYAHQALQGRGPQVYAHGVAKNFKVLKTAGGFTGRPFVSASVYAANPKTLDHDHDGVECEK